MNIRSRGRRPLGNMVVLTNLQNMGVYKLNPPSYTSKPRGLTRDK